MKYSQVGDKYIVHIVLVSPDTTPTVYIHVTKATIFRYTFLYLIMLL